MVYLCAKMEKLYFSPFFELLVNKGEKKKSIVQLACTFPTRLFQIWQEPTQSLGLFSSQSNPHLWNEAKKRSSSTENSLKRREVEAWKVKLGSSSSITTTMGLTVTKLLHTVIKILGIQVILVVLGDKRGISVQGCG